MNKIKLEKLSRFIFFLDKISYIPALSVSIIFLLFSFEILIKPLNWIDLFSTYLLGALIGFLIYNYDKNKISPKINNQEYDNIVLDTFCLGIIGCIFHGTGIIILVKFLAIIYYKYDVITLRNKEVMKRSDLYLEIKLYDSLNSLASMAGFVIISLVLYNVGFNSIINTFTQVVSGNFQVLFDPFIIFLLAAVVILLFNHKNNEFLDIGVYYDSKVGTKDLVTGVIGCCFYGSGIFIMLKGIILVLIHDNKKSYNKGEIVKRVKDKVIYSKPIYLN
ncbi:MAG: hypothetical protein ACXAES_18240 [Promethearchaeota archaeon]